MASPPQNEAIASLATDNPDNIPLALRDPRTVDGKALYIQVTVLEPELIEKDGEKFMAYPLSTEVC